MQALVPQVLAWWHQLPAAKQDLLVGIKVGHESSIGVSGYYYPNGNRYAERPAAEDPVVKLDNRQVVGRGMSPIGYAAVTTLGSAHRAN